VGPALPNGAKIGTKANANKYLSATQLIQAIQKSSEFQDSIAKGIAGINVEWS